MKLKHTQQGHIGADGPGSDDEPWLKWSWLYALYTYLVGLLVSFLILAVWVAPECYLRQNPTMPMYPSVVFADAWFPSMVWPVSWISYYGIYRTTGSLCGPGIDKEKS